jgi:hypothetical protein
MRTGLNDTWLRTVLYVFFIFPFMITVAIGFAFLGVRSYFLNFWAICNSVMLQIIFVIPWIQIVILWCSIVGVYQPYGWYMFTTKVEAAHFSQTSVTTYQFA